jgi:hypothetical protein
MLAPSIRDRYSQSICRCFPSSTPHTNHRQVSRLSVEVAGLRARLAGAASRAEVAAARAELRDGLAEIVRLRELMRTGSVPSPHPLPATPLSAAAVRAAAGRGRTAGQAAGVPGRQAPLSWAPSTAAATAAAAAAASRGPFDSDDDDDSDSPPPRGRPAGLGVAAAADTPLSVARRRAAAAGALGGGGGGGGGWNMRSPGSLPQYAWRMRHLASTDATRRGGLVSVAAKQASLER